MKTVFLAGICLVTLCANAQAAGIHLHRSRQTASVSMRKRLHINDLITEPGTVEIDWGTLYSYSTSNFTMPSAMKYTPDGDTLLIGRTEYSVVFDAVASTVDGGSRSAQFSDHVTLTATSVLLDTTHFDIAIAPQATFFLRDASGARFGATVIAREDIGLNSIGGIVSWTGATTSSSSNPAGTWDFGAGLGHHLAGKGILARFTPHINTVWERSTGFDYSFGAYAGVEYQITPRVAFDASGQRIGLNNTVDRQILFSMTINLGKPH